MSVLRRNMLFLVVSQGATWVATLLLLVLAPRKLDAEGFGLFQFVQAYVGFFALVGGLGTYAYVVKRVARDGHELAPLVISAVKLKIVIWAGLSVLALGLGWLIGYRGQTMVLIAIGCSGMVLQLLNEVVLAGLSGMERMARAAFWQTVQVYVGTFVGLGIVMLGGPLEAFVAAMSYVWAIPLVANYFQLRPFLRIPSDAAVRRMPWKPIIVGGAPLLVLTVLNTIYGTIDIPILQKISGSEVVGWYTVAYKWMAMPIFITTIIGVAFFPRMSAYAARSAEDFAALTNKAIRLALFVTIPASVGLMATAGDVFHLIYGHEFDESIALVQILSIHIPMAALGTVLATALIAADRQNRYIWVALVAAILNPLAAIAAINYTQTNYDNGAIGAAVVTVLTEVYILVCALHMRPKGIMDRHTSSFVLRSLVAVSVMAGCLFLVKDAPIFVKVVVGAVTYVVASLALRIVSVDRVKATLVDIRSSRGAVPAVEHGGNHEMSETGVDS